MKCKFSKELSELKSFANDADHCYLKAVFVPKEMNYLQTLTMGNAAQFQINIYPGRNADSSVNEEQMNALIELFKSGDLEKDEYLVGRVKVPVEPFLMKRSRNSQNGNAGDIIMDGIKPRVYDYINITTFMEMKNDEEVSVIDENTLKTRAISIKNFRIKNGDWIDYTEYMAKTGQQEEEPTDVDYEETTVEEKPAEQSQKPKRW